MLSSVQALHKNQWHQTRELFLYKRMFILCSCSYHHRFVSQYLFVCHSFRFYFKPLTFNLLFIMRFRVLIILFLSLPIVSCFIDGFFIPRWWKNKRKALLKSKRQKISGAPGERQSGISSSSIAAERYKKNFTLVLHRTFLTLLLCFLAGCCWVVGRRVRVAWS
jgi:hypothetical protein